VDIQDLFSWRKSLCSVNLKKNKRYSCKVSADVLLNTGLKYIIGPPFMDVFWFGNLYYHFQCCFQGRWFQCKNSPIVLLCWWFSWFINQVLFMLPCIQVRWKSQVDDGQWSLPTGFIWMDITRLHFSWKSQVNDQWSLLASYGWMLLDYLRGILFPSNTF
jgi:hypothetical protein